METRIVNGDEEILVLVDGVQQWRKAYNQKYDSFTSDGKQETLRVLRPYVDEEAELLVLNPTYGWEIISL